MKWRFQKSSGLMMIFWLVFFCFGIEAENPKQESLWSPQEFFAKSPIPTQSLTWSPSSSKQLTFSENNEWEMELIGKIETKNDLYFNSKKINAPDTGNFKIQIVLSTQKTTYELVTRNAAGVFQSYPFEVVLSKEPPLPLRAKIRVGEDKYIVKGFSQSGNYLVEDWVRLTWLKPKNEIPPEILQLIREKERKEKELALRQQEEERRLKEEEKARAIAAQIEMESQLRYESRSKEFWGWSFDQGVAILSSQKTGQPRVSSSNWLINLAYRKALDEKTFLQLDGQTFAFPFSVSGARTGPRLLKVSLTGGVIREIAPRLYWLPAFGGVYQSLDSPTNLGYSGQVGPQVNMTIRYDLSDKQVIQSTVSLSTFGGLSQYGSLSQFDLSYKLVVEWKNFSPFFQSFYLGGEVGQSSIGLGSNRFSGGVYSGFLGVKF